MPLEDYYSGDKAFQEYSLCFLEEWENFDQKYDLLRLVNGDIDLARPIAYHLLNSYNQWFFTKIPALDNASPSDCMKSPQGIKRLKECLMRFP